MMNTRGLMELVVLNKGYDLGIIPKPVFSVFVIMAVVTTYMTAPALRRLIRGTELQAAFDISPLMEGHASAMRERAGNRLAGHGLLVEAISGKTRRLAGSEGHHPSSQFNQKKR
jgi:hypothetical protein